MLIKLLLVFLLSMRPIRLTLISSSWKKLRLTFDWIPLPDLTFSIGRLLAKFG